MKKKKLSEYTIKGVSISPGLAMGRAYIYTDVLLRDHEFYTIKSSEMKEEFRRIEQALLDVTKDLALSAERIERELNSQIAGIFFSQAEILKDPELLKELKTELEVNLVNAEQIVKRVFRKWELRFRQIQDEIICCKADDIVDLSRRLIRALTGIHVHTLERLPSGSIIIAKRLLPSDTVFLSRKSAKGIVTESGGPASHAALLTREIGIPAMGKINGVLDLIHQGDFLLIDGAEGKLIVNPTEKTKKVFHTKLKRRSADFKKNQKKSWGPAVCRNGAVVEVMANVSCRKDVEFSIDNGADGIGLFRIENIYLSRKLPPSAMELHDEIAKVIAPAQNKSVTIRLLDIGGDKKLTYLNSVGVGVDDSFLGRRGIRFLLEYPELLYTQFNALIKLSEKFNIKILVPMVTFWHEMQIVREIFEEMVQLTNCNRKILLGAMIETPAAALCVSDFIPYVDFFSIGTNDLTQYTMAAGRENHTVIDYFLDNHPAVFKLIDSTMKNAGEVPVSLCGELASEINMLKSIIKIGIKSISVAPSFIPDIKEAIRST
ncbi:MAG TPA: phosphoenolpyruvate--protein phosphotransferase [Chitinispirillaceae bacterium]|nr:phosphoenolpyruvate--protein phosphotransferase [Chitinispirillaceae bacterium]